MSVDKAAELAFQPLVRIAAYASAGVDPAFIGIGPVFATCKTLDRAGWCLQQVDLIEANEAFAAQAIAVGRELQWDSAKVNVNGGAIAPGYPIGAWGCRILVSLIPEIQRREARRCLATLCIRGGQGVALLIENARFT
ncbi:acetyl-CoA C-acyltransferase [Pseudomonas sp. S31]|nr:acetyl-CoA C-acyltransferase [Pseudomonas sp. S31]